MDEEIKKVILSFQKNEITEYFIYKKFSKKEKGENAKILNKIANEELAHYEILEKLTGKKVLPSRFKIFLYSFIEKIFGLTFALKFMERGEEKAQRNYENYSNLVQDGERILNEEKGHEKELINMIDEERINYIGSIVLGLNDAIVELTGALAGLTFALRNPKIVGIAGFITGISASLSMAASEFISQKSEGKSNPLKASFYTGIAYIFAVLLLIFSYFIIKNPYIDLLITILIAFFIIFIFTYFVSIVKEISFKKMFFEMLLISFGVAFVSFLIGLFTRKFLKIEI
ncbi:MAG: VIT1/CCC1 transporter family protein [candidate division WOR-3 bacterium]